MSDASRGPRIFVPPPLVFVGGWLFAWGLHLRLPFEIDGAGASVVQILIGMLILAGGLLLGPWAAMTFVRERTPIVPIAPARLVVTSGPFRFTRNPMYLGLTLGYFGLAVLFNDAWPIVLLPVVLMVLSTWIIAREERYLRATFGTAYEEYCARVRRWL